jgi:hypothetical protein
VAIADIHGDYAAFAGILSAAGLADAKGNWTGGPAVLVQTGDYLDRGTDVRRILDLLRALESQARKAGGRAHVLLGNHEAMNLLVELRDVNPEAYAAFVDRNSDKRRDRAFAEYRNLAERRDADLGEAAPVYGVRSRDAWMAAHPAGLIEYVAALGPDGSYGRWLRERPVIADVDGTLLMHAGLDPATAPATIEAVNRTVRDEIGKYDRSRRHLAARKIILPFFTLSETVAAAVAEAEAVKAGRVAADPAHLEMLNVVLGIGQSPLLSSGGPLWYRGFATWSDAEGPAQVSALLDRYGASRFVAGHSVQRGRGIVSRFDHRLFLIDTGMLARVYNGRASALEISGSTITAVYPDQRVVLAGPSTQRPALVAVR